MISKKDKVAFLDAGGLGACVALELSQGGYFVDLYEEHSLPLWRASYANEGKVHLGFILCDGQKFPYSPSDANWCCSLYGIPSAMD